MLEFWVWGGVVERILKGLGRRGGFLSPNESFRLSGLDLLADI